MGDVHLVREYTWARVAALVAVANAARAVAQTGEDHCGWGLADGWHEWGALADALDTLDKEG